MDYSPPGSSVRGIFQARILELIAISFSKGSFEPRDWSHVCCIGRQILYHWASGFMPQREFLIYLFCFVFLLFIFFSFIFISWRLITLQYCSSFCHTLTWISHGFTCVPHPDPPSCLPPHPIPLGLPSAPAPSICLMHPTWTGYLFHPWEYTCFNASLSENPTLAFSHRVPKSTRKSLQLINEYSNVAGYKINTQKSLASLYTSNEKTEREIKETIPFTIATKRIKYLGVYLPNIFVRRHTYVIYCNVVWDGRSRDNLSIHSWKTVSRIWCVHTMANWVEAGRN